MGVKPGYKQTEVGVIPEEWEAMPVGNLALFTSGCGISVAALCLQSSDHPVPVFGGNGIAGYTKRAIVSEPTVVVGRVGQRCGEVCLTNGPAWITDNALYPRAIRRKLDVRFLSMALAAAGLNDVKNRNDLPLVTQSILHAVCVPWPPDTVEQRAIATALSDVDGLLDGLDRLIAKKRDLKQAAMQQLLTGLTRLPGFCGEWEVKAIGDSIDLLTGFPFSSAEYSDSGIRLLRGTNVKRGVTDWSDHLVQCWPRMTSDIARYELREGDLVIAMDGSLVGRSYARLQKLDLPAVLLQRVARIRSTKLDIGYLTQFVGSDIFISYCDSVKTVTAIPHISPSDIRNFRIPVPPDIKEQTAIAAVLAEMDAELAALTQRRDKTRALKQAMMQELLTGRTRLIPKSIPEVQP